MKAYTDLEQSRKLAEILPLEGADMRYAPFGDTHPWIWDEKVKLLEKGSVPCWSLAALLDMLPQIQGFKPTITLYYNYISYPHRDDLYANGDNLVDVCYEMIIKLHEQKLL